MGISNASQDKRTTEADKERNLPGLPLGLLAGLVAEQPTAGFIVLGRVRGRDARCDREVTACAAQGTGDGRGSDG